MASTASWNLNLVNMMGQALGRDSRARGVHILLAPGVNIHRAPMGGRNFEYMGEDPFLAGKMAVAYIKGVQSQRVVATVKHYAGNDQEWDRNGVSSNIDERTLQEIYLPAFKAAVKEGKVGCAMNSYNLVNGEHATQNNHLNNEIMKGMWGFDGFIMSDWGSTYDGIAAAKGGLDLEMPNSAFMSKTTLKAAIQNGQISEKLIDEKVTRILRILFRFGFYDKAQQDKNIPLDDPKSAAVALNVAREGIVLLKNQNGLLPLSTNKIKTLAVVGPNAARYVAGGGSSYTETYHSVNTLQGIQNLVGKQITVRSSAMSSMNDLVAQSVYYTEAGSEAKGLKAEYFDNPNLSGAPACTRIDAGVNFDWGNGAPISSNFPTDKFSARWTGVVKPAKTDAYCFKVNGDDGFRLWVNDKLVIDNWRDEGATTKETVLDLKAGEAYSVKLEYYENAGTASIHFGWVGSSASFDDATIANAANADAAIVCVGFDSNSEQEGADRTYKLPFGQDSLICKIASVNPNTIVVLNGGGNVDMSAWLPKVKGLLHAWYAGQEGGTALAEILFGKVNPSGKLPVSFEKRWEDNPTFNSYYDVNGSKNVSYSEGLLVGYRYYDTKKVAPLFPFGFGLSYTTFAYSNLSVVPATNVTNEFTVSFEIQNTGKVAGAEAAQVYVRPLNAKVFRPYKELKGFTKVTLKPGEKKRVSVVLNADAFAYFQTTLNKFVVDKGQYEVIVGASSKDLKLRKVINVTKDSVLK
ncbi:MAG: glycoside hydrolase family 3 C-terminal domain-containing protein [Bacteroidota bacterium]|nr:glycoside hydrolase family 3 C-terminal domain-containing protein [Bacteroidota bacterium]